MSKTCPKCGSQGSQTVSCFRSGICSKRGSPWGVWAVLGHFLQEKNRNVFFQLCGRDLDFRVLKTGFLELFRFWDQVRSVSGAASAQNGPKKGPKMGSLKIFRKKEIRDVLSRVRRLVEMAPSVQLFCTLGDII